MHAEAETSTANEPTAPLYVQADDTLNRIRESLMSRAATIEGEMKRLEDEYRNVNAVLSRIAPPTPAAYPVGHPIAPGSHMNAAAGSSPRGW